MEHSYDSLVNTINGIVWQADPKTFQFSFVSRSAVSLLGYAVQQWLDSPAFWKDHIHPDDRERALSYCMSCIEQKRSHQFEYRMIAADGRIVYLHDNVSVIVENDEPVLLRGIMTDITERKLAEERNILQAELLNTIGQAVVVTTPDGIINFWNKGAEKIYGWAENESIGKNIIDLIPTRDTQKKAIEIMKQLQLGHSWSGEFMAQRKNGQDFPIYVTDSPIYDQHHKFSGIIGVSFDITERKNGELLLKESIERYSYVTTATFDAIWDWDVVSNEVFFGEGFINLFGAMPDSIEPVAEKLRKRIHPQEIEKLFDNVSKALKGTGTNWSYEHRYLKSDGRYAYVLNKAIIVRNNVGKAIRVVGAMQDITQRKQDEFALQQSEARLRGIIASQTNYIIRTDLAGNYTYYNPKFLDDFGFLHNEADITGINSLTSIMEYDHQRVKDAVEKCFAKMNEVVQVEIDKPAKDGGVKTTLWDFICLTDLYGNPTEIQCVGIDISDRKKAERAFINTLEEKNIILESIGDAFFAVDKAWVVTYWNSNAEKMLGKSKDEMEGQPLWQVFSDSIDSESYKKYNEAVTTRQAVHFEDYYPLLSRWFDVSAYPSYKGLSVYFKDITERKFIEIRLNELNTDLQIQARELAVSNEELENFAYVASHDLQEPLRMVSSFLQLLQKKYDSRLDETANKYINFAVDGANRMKKLILDLLEYSKINTVKEVHSKVDLDQMVSGILQTVKDVIDESKISVLISRLPLVCGNELQLFQLFQNLIGNALKYRNEVQPSLEIGYVENNAEWRFFIKDNGIGIEAKYFDKIFIIFQRLHGRQHYDGTGMGLAICKKIVELHRGKIWVESEMEKGTTFYFTISKTLCTDPVNVKQGT